MVGKICPPPLILIGFTDLTKTKGVGLGQLPPSYSGIPVIHFMCIIMILSPRDIFSNFTKSSIYIHDVKQIEKRGLLL